jgi:hypothetical protein
MRRRSVRSSSSSISSSNSVSSANCASACSSCARARSSDLALPGEVALPHEHFRHRPFHIGGEQGAGYSLGLARGGYAHDQRVADHLRGADRDGDLGAEGLGRFDLRLIALSVLDRARLLLGLQGAEPDVDPAQCAQQDHDD